jgi:lipid-binding SYLF domain-containing protein
MCARLLLSSNAVKDNNVQKQGTAAQAAAFMEGFTLGAEIRKAAYTIQNFTSKGVVSDKDKQIPQKLLGKAKGLVFLHTLKAGFVWAAQIGSGCIICRLDDGSWSAPCAIASVGMGIGGQIGAEATNHVLVLTTAAAVKTFTGKGQFTLGAEIGVALGPVGRNAVAQVGIGRKGLAPILSYSHSKGLFAGVSVEGAVIAVRPDVNKNFYGINLKPRYSRFLLTPRAPQTSLAFLMHSIHFHSYPDTHTSH